MRHNALHFDVTQRGGGQKAARQFQHTRQSLLFKQLINRRAADHPLDGDLRSDRRHLHRIAVFQPRKVRLHSMQQKVIDIHRLDQLRAAIVFKDAHGPALRWPASDE